jgi:hypothetical protein
MLDLSWTAVPAQTILAVAKAGHLRALEVLSLLGANHGFDDVFLSTLAPCVRALRHINVSRLRHVTAVGLSSLACHCPTWDSLSAKQCAGLDDGVVTAVPPGTLRRLALGAAFAFRDGVTGAGLADLLIRQQATLERLDLTFPRGVPDDVSHLAPAMEPLAMTPFPALRHLVLHHAALNDIGLSVLLAHTPALTHLHLHDCVALTAAGMDHVLAHGVSYTTLTSLIVESCPAMITDSGLRALGRAPLLSHLIDLRLLGVPRVSDTGWVDLCSGPVAYQSPLRVLHCSGVHAVTERAVLALLTPWCERQRVDTTPSVVGLPDRFPCLSTLCFIWHEDARITSMAWQTLCRRRPELNTVIGGICVDAPSALLANVLGTLPPMDWTPSRMGASWCRLRWTPLVPLWVSSGGGGGGGGGEEATVEVVEDTPDGVVVPANAAAPVSSTSSWPTMLRPFDDLTTTDWTAARRMNFPRR